MESATLRQDLVELLLLLAHVNPIQFKAICQFVQITPHSSHEAWLPQLVPLLQKATPSQTQRLKEAAKKGEDGTGEFQVVASELSVGSKDLDTFRGAFVLLLALYQLQRLLQSLSILQLMKMFEIMPPGPPVQQLQLLQQIQQLFSQLKTEALLNLHKTLEEAPPGKEQQILIGSLSLPSDFFQLYQPLRLLLQLDAEELGKFKQTLPQLEPPQVLQLLQLLQLQPFDVLELRNLLSPGSEEVHELVGSGTQPSISQTPMESMEETQEDKRAELHLQIVEQPPEKSVYKRNLKPNPIVMLVGDQKLNDGNLYVVPTLVRCDTFTEEPKFLTGNRPVRVASGRVMTFRKLKITTTSHQQQETLFCVKFELRKYSGDDEYTVLDSVHSSPICVLSHSTQMKPVPSVTSVIAEVIPSSGTSEGGTRVAILGSNFVDSPAARIRFDATDVMPTFHGPGTLICYTPQHSPGTVSVRVSNSPKKWSETQASFTYHDHYATYQGHDQVSISLSPPSHFDEMSGDWPNGNEFGSPKDGQPGSIFNSLDPRGYGSLHYASSMGNHEVIAALLDKGADVNLADKNGNSPLLWACIEGQGECVQVLLDHGASCSQPNFLGVTPLYAAVADGNKKLVDLLLASGAPPNACTLQGDTPLHVAAVSPVLPVLRSLLDNGAFANLQDEDGDTPLHWAIRAENSDAAEMLMSRGGTAVDIANDDGEQPIHLAVTLGDGQEAVIQSLLDHGAPVDCGDNEGLSPLHLASSLGHEGVVRQLVENGAALNAKDKQGQTPLHAAVVARKSATANYLVQVGASLESRDKNGNTALDLTTRKMLADLGAHLLPTKKPLQDKVICDKHYFVQKASAQNRIVGSFVDV